MGIEHAHGRPAASGAHLFAQGDHPIARDWRASSTIRIPRLREKRAWSNIAIAGKTTALPAGDRRSSGATATAKLHCEDGPAARWRDGTTIYARHGERYPASAIEDPAAMILETVLTEPEHGVRRDLVARYPLERLLAEADATRDDHRSRRSDAYGRVLTIALPPEPAYEKAIRTYGIEWVKLRIYLPSPAARKRCRRLAVVHIDDFGRWERGKQVFTYLDSELPGLAGVRSRLRLWRMAR